jgi:small subunit ribosomal protein S18
MAIGNRKKRGRGAPRDSMRKPKRLNLGIKADQPIDYKDVELLRKAIGGQGQQYSRRRTALSAQRQRELKKAIKRARHLALLPFVG